MSSPLMVYTLGGLTVRRDKATVTGFISRKVEALLVYLLAERREHPREVVAEFLWDDLPQARSMANLRMAISSLQQQLAPYVSVTRQTIAINPHSPVWADMTELDAVLSEAEQRWTREGRLPRAFLTKLGETLKLYRGDFLAGFHVRESSGFEDWKLVEQERLRGRVMAAMDRVVEQHLERGDCTSGIEQANRLLQLDPLREEAHRQLIRLYVGAGQRGAAAAQYESCRRILQQELGAAPDDETTRLFQQIQEGLIEVIAPAEAKHNLPYLATPFVERSAEQQQIRLRLDNPACRLLTLVGPGGNGKTRLALHEALERIEDFSDGVYLVSLVAVDDPHHLVSTIASVLNIKTADHPLDDLIRHLLDKRILLILDNFEQLVASAAIVHRLLSQTKWLKCIVTSRERLNLQEEWLLPVGGIEFPTMLNGSGLAEDYGAVKLFVQSAQRAQADFSLAGNERSVCAICQSVEGMPLAIELAAAWTRLMTCDQIAAQIERDLGLLKTNLRNVPERHRSVPVLFEHSFQMLSSDERTALMRLSVFAGGFTLEGAASVGQTDLMTLRLLVEKSLLRHDGSGRYDMHELVRRCAYDRLVSAGQLDTTMSAAAAFFVGLVRAAPAGDEAMRVRLDPEYSNIRLLLEWTLRLEQAETLIQLATGLARFYWRVRGDFDEGSHWLEQALAFGDLLPPEVYLRGLMQAGLLGFYRGDLERARQRLEESLRLYDSLDPRPTTSDWATDLASIMIGLGHVHARLGSAELTRSYYERALKQGRLHGHRPTITRALLSLGGMEVNLANIEQARHYNEEGLVLARELRGRHSEAVALYNLGYVMIELGEFTQALAYYEEALSIGRELRHKPLEADVYAAMGEMYLRAREPRLALDCLRESLTLLQQHGDKVMTLFCLEVRACLFIAESEFYRGLLLFGATEAAREAMRSKIHPRDAALHQQHIARAQQVVEADEYRAVWAEGRTMTVTQAIELALSQEQYVPVQEIAAG